MQVRKRIKTAKPESEFDKSLEQELLSYCFEIAEIINKGILFSDNFNAEIKDVTDTGNADTEFTIAHTLKKAPTGFVMLKINKAGIVYDDESTAWTDTDIYLKCNVANAKIKVLIF